MGRYRARDVAVDLAFNAGLVLMGALVVWLTSWSRFWVLVVVLTVGWATRIATQRRRAAGSPEAAERDSATR
ncbi:hypothetical protein [Modestobacter sp. SYSU DS0875]